MDPKDLPNWGGHAFPWCGDLNETPFINLGMSLRDYFAAKAMEALIAQVFVVSNESRDILRAKYGTVSAAIVADAYDFADQMLKARAA